MSRKNDLSGFVPILTDAAKSHRAGSAEAWDIGGAFVDLHLAALQTLSEAAKTTPSESNTALIGLTCHGFNLYVAAFDLATSGKFDVAILLMRAIFDCGPLVYAVAKDDAIAKRFNEDSFSGADARKLQIDDIASLEPELAAGLTRQWKSEYDAVNKAAHVKAVHSEKLLAIVDGQVTPWVGGREDLEECTHMYRAANFGEFWHLSSLANFRVELLGGAWVRRFKAAGRKFDSWMKETKHELEKEQRS